MKIGVGYIRMSTDRQEASPDMQKDIIQEYAEKNNIYIAKWYEDLAISGGALDKRSSMMELILDAENNMFNIVLFFKYDRAFRNIEEQSIVLNRFDKLGIEYIGIKDPQGEGASGRLVRNILGSINQFERELTGERIFYHNRKRRKDGKWTGPNPPLGYLCDKDTKVLKIDLEESKVVNMIKDMYLEYKSLGRVAKELRVKNILTRNGNYYSSESLSYILRHPVYIGKIRWNYRGENTEIFEGQHEPLWSIAEWDLIQKTLDRNKYNNSGNHSTHLLTPLLICGHCGKKMKGSKGGGDKKNTRLYKCYSKAKYGNDFCNMSETMRSDVIDPIVENRLINNIKSINLTIDNPIIDTVQDNPESEIARLERLIEKHKNLYLMDLINEKELKSKIDELNKQIEIEKNIINNDSINFELIEELKNFENIYNEACKKDKRDLLCAFIENIIIHDRYNFTINYKSLNFGTWKLDEHLNLNVTKKWISKKEKERILDEFIL